MSTTSLQKRLSNGALTIRKYIGKFEAKLFLPKLTNGLLRFNAAGELEATTAPNLVNPTEVVAATNVITAAESGKVFFLNAATEFVSTLPAPAAGLNFEFIVTAAPDGASYTIVTASSANIIKGSIVTSATGAADTEATGGDTISFVDGTAVAGDRVQLRCDGTNWFAYGICAAAGGITITTAS
jgi:hypothetical protein